MKKLSQSIWKSFKMPYLYLDDINEIERIITTELQPKEYKIEFCGYEYNNVNEISSKTSNSTKLRIISHSPYLNIDFGDNHSIISSYDDDLKTVGAIDKISKIISKRERKLLWYASQLSAFLASLPIIILSFLIKNYKNVLLSGNLFYLLIILFCFIAWVIIGYRSLFYKYSKIEFINSSEKPNIFIKNKDQIFVGVIIAILSYLLGKI